MIRWIKGTYCDLVGKERRYLENNTNKKPFIRERWGQDKVFCRYCLNCRIDKYIINIAKSNHV